MIDLDNVPGGLRLPILQRNLAELEKRHKVYSHFLAGVRLQLAAESAWLDRGPGHGEPWVEGNTELVDSDLARSFSSDDKNARPTLPPNVLLSRVKVNGRLHGVLGVARQSRPFRMGRGRELTRLAQLLGADLERRQEKRLARVLDRIRGKVVSELRPKDLAYQILDGLHQLVRYDHSAALLTWHEDAQVFRVAAEKVVWTKSKSPFIGHELKGSVALLASLRESSAVRILPSAESIDEVGRPLRDLLDYSRGGSTPEVSDLLCAPLFFDEEFLGVLKIAAYEGRGFDAYDVEVVERFLPAAAVSLRNVRVKQALENQAMEAEVRAGLVTRARAVAHDVNNAIGTILPLTQQARADLVEGNADLGRLKEDLDLVIEKAILCKRIFSNMLRAAGRRSAGRGPVDVRQIGEGIVSIMEAHLASAGVELELDLAEGLRPVCFSRPHLERVLWNLVTNAIEALTDTGGVVTIRARNADDGRVTLSVLDDGPGIEADLLDKVQEPFFTTKRDGTGLGLALARSLVWQNDGAMEVHSELGRGTEVQLSLAADGDCGEVET